MPELANRYQIDWMLPSECADRLASGAADIGLVPIASLATTPGSAHSARLHHRFEGQRTLPVAGSARRQGAESICAVSPPITASRTTLAYARILFHKWGNPEVPFLPMAADLDVMLDRADAAIVIGDPALLALEERANRFERTGEELVYHDLAEEWRTSSPACPSSLPSGRHAPGSVLEESIRRGLHPLSRSRAAEHRCARRRVVAQDFR